MTDPTPPSPKPPETTGEKLVNSLVLLVVALMCLLLGGPLAYSSLASFFDVATGNEGSFVWVIASFLGGIVLLGVGGAVSWALFRLWRPKNG